MQDQNPSEDTPIVVRESSELEEIGSAIKGILDEGLAMEAMVRLSRLRTPDQGDVLLMLPGEHRTTLLSLLAPSAVGNILEQLGSVRAVQLSGDMEPNQLSRVLDETRPDAAADVLRGLPDEVAIQALLGMQEASSVTPLLEYEDDAAGGLMTPDFIALRDNMTVMQAMSFIRGIADNLDPEDVQYLFVVDRNGVLKGGISLSQLVLGRPYQRVSLLIYPEAISVPVETDREYCARLMERYNLSNLPVVDEEGKLVGVLKLRDMLGVIEEEATEDMYRLIGLAEKEK
ncbi:MAG: magnesium transporter, partial [Chloroflexi bacterium]|nr:magnesium transporter [Chloroflexota bacterium]